MKTMSKTKIILKYIPYLIIAVLIVFSTITTKVANTRKQNIRILENEISLLEKKNSELENLNGISVSVEFQIKTTNILSFNANNCSVVAREIAQMTRKEVLDSLKTKQNTTDGTIQPKQKK